MKTPRQWFDFKAADENGDAEIYIFDRIGKTYWDDGPVMSARKFIEQLQKLKATHIALHINSPGGDVFEGHAIYNAIKRHPAGVTTYIDGLAASIASEVACAGDTVIPAANAMLMIHKSWCFDLGNATDLRKTADTLDKLDESIITCYADRTGMDRTALAAAMAAETWYTADEMLAAGFADQVGDEIQVAALERSVHGLAPMGYANVPRFLATLDSEVEETLKIARALAKGAVDKIDEVLDADETGDGAEDSAGAADTRRTIGSEVAALLTLPEN